MATLDLFNDVNCDQLLDLSAESNQHASRLRNSNVADGPGKQLPESSSVMVDLFRQGHTRSTRVRLAGRTSFPRRRNCCNNELITPVASKKPAGHGKTPKSPRNANSEQFSTSPQKPGVVVKPATHPETDAARVKHVRACTLPHAVIAAQFAASDGKLTTRMPKRQQSITESPADISDTAKGRATKTCKTTRSDLDCQRKSSTVKKLFEEKPSALDLSIVKSNRRTSLPTSFSMTSTPTICRDELSLSKQSVVASSARGEAGETGASIFPGVDLIVSAEASFLDRPITTSLSGQLRTNIFAVAEKLSESRGGSPQVFRAIASVSRSLESSCESIPAKSKRQNKKSACKLIDPTSSPRPCRWKCIEHESCKMLFQPQSLGNGSSTSISNSMKTSAGRKRKRSSQNTTPFECSDHLACSMLSSCTKQRPVSSLPDLEGPSEILRSSCLGKSRSSEMCSESARSLEMGRNVSSEQVRNSPSKPGSSAALPLESRSHSASRCEENSCPPLEVDIKKRGRKPKKRATSTETATAMDITALSSASIEVRSFSKPGRKKSVASLLCVTTNNSATTDIVRRKRPAKKRSLSESVVGKFIQPSDTDLLSSCGASETSPTENSAVRQTLPNKRRLQSAVTATGGVSAKSDATEKPLPKTEIPATPSVDSKIGISKNSDSKNRPVSAKKPRSASVDCCPRQLGVNAARKLMRRGRTSRSRVEAQTLGSSDMEGQLSANLTNIDIKMADAKGTNRATRANYRCQRSSSVETAVIGAEEQPSESSTDAVELVPYVVEPAASSSLAFGSKRKSAVKRRRRSASIEPDNLAAKKPSAKRRSSLVKARDVKNAEKSASTSREPGLIDANDIEMYLLGSAESRLSVNSDDHFESNASSSKTNDASGHLICPPTAALNSDSETSIAPSSSCCSTLSYLSATIALSAQTTKKSALKRPKRSRRREAGDGFNECNGDGVNCSIDADSDSDDELPAMSTAVDDQFEVGDLIWVKYRRDPFWPAVVLKMPTVSRKLHVRLVFLNYLPDGKPKHYDAISLKYSRKKMLPIAKDFKQLKADGLANCKDDSFGRAISKVEDYLLDLASTSSLQENATSRLQFVRHFFAVDLSPNNGNEESASNEDEYTLPSSPSCNREKSVGPDDDDEEETEDYIDGLVDDSDDSKEAYPEHVQRRIAERFQRNEKLVEFISSQTLKNHLFDVENGLVESCFCTDFDLKSQTCRGRTELRCRGFGPIAEHEQMMYKVVEILEGYWDELCKQRGQQNNVEQRYSYILHAWLPEAIVTAFQHVDNASREEAEIAFRKGIPRTAEEKENELKQLHALMSQLSRRRSNDGASNE